MHNWDCDIMLLNQSLQVHLQFNILSWQEFDWRFGEKRLALLIDFSIGNASVFRVALDVMLILSRLIYLLLLDPSDHFVFLEIEALQFGRELELFIVVEFDQLLSLVFFKLSPLLNEFILLIFDPAVPVALRFQIDISSLPEKFLFPLGDDVETSALSLVDQLNFLVEKVAVLLNGSLNALHVRSTSIAILAHNFFNFGGIEPEPRFLEQSQISDGDRLRPRHACCAVDVDPLILLE